MAGKNGELGGLKAEMESQPSKLPVNDVSLTAENLPVKVIDSSIDDPHDSWDIDAFNATLPVLNKAVEDVKEGDVSFIDVPYLSNSGSDKKEMSPGHGQVIYGAARKSMLEKQAKEVEAKTGYKAESETQENPLPSWRVPDLNSGQLRGVKDGGDSNENKEVVRKLETGSDKKETAEYKSARAEWLSNRERSNVLRTEYNQKYEAYLQDQTKENSFKKGWRATRKWLGLEPQLSEELVNLSNEAEIARHAYFESSEKIRQIRLGDIEETSSAISERRSVSDASREATAGQIDDVRKLMDRYGNMLIQSVSLGAFREQQAIQERVAGSVPESVASKRIKSTLETLRKYSHVRRGTMALGYGVLAGATGGLGAAALAGGGYLVRVTGGAIIGSATYHMLRRDGEENVKQKEQELSETESRAGQNLFQRGLAETEAEIERQMRVVERAKGNARIKATAGAVAAGFLGGNGVGGMIDSLEFDSGGKLRIFDTNNSPAKASMTPSSGGGETVPSNGVGEVVPQGSGGGLEEEHAALDRGPSEDGAEDYEHEEDVFGEPAFIHTVVRGDNAWNIMKANSSILKGLSLAEQNKWQVKLWNSLTPEEAIKAGFVRSGGDVNLIYPEDMKAKLPADEISVSMLDQKLSELMQKESGDIPIPTPKPDLDDISNPAEVPSEPQETPTDVGSKPVLLSPESVDTTSTYPEADPRALSLIDELKKLGERHEDRINNAKDPAALERAHQMQVEQKIKHFARQNNIELEKAIDIINEARSAYIDQNLGDGDGKISLAEAENARKIFESNPAFRNLTELDQRYFPSRAESQMVYEPSSREVETEITPNVSEPVSNEISTESPLVKEYVSGVEKSTGGWLFNGVPDVSGTFDAIKELKLSEINKMVANDSLPDGIKQEGWDRWVALVKDQSRAGFANDDATLGQYVARLANTRTA